jgi:hypothetical protein
VAVDPVADGDVDGDPVDADPLADDPLDADPLEDDRLGSGGLDVGAALEAPPEQAPSIRHRSPSAAAAVRGRRVVVMPPSLSHASPDGQRTCRAGARTAATRPRPRAREAVGGSDRPSASPRAGGGAGP